MSDFQIYANSPRLLVSPRNLSNQASPNRYDNDFYRRKAERLEEDVFTLSDELNKARIRLRRAQDYQIKYDLLFKQKSLVEEDSAKKQKELFELRAKNQQLRLMVGEKSNKTQDINYQKINVLKDLQIWKEKALQADQKMRLIVAEQQNRATEKIQKELAKFKRNFNQAEQQYKFQIARMTKQLQEKSSSDNGVYEKNQRIKKQKQNEIARLQKVVQKNRQQFLTMLQEKNKEIQMIRNKFQQIFNDQIGHLKKNMGAQDQKFSSELEGLRQLIEIKNAQIINLQNQLKINLQEYNKQRDELNYEIKLLKEKIYQRQRENEKELFNMKERLTSLHAIDIQAMKSHYQELIQGLRDERQQLQKLLVEKDLKVQFELKQFERGRDELKNIIRDKDRTIQELKQNQMSHVQSNSNQINNIQQSLAKLTSQKETLNSQYQANIAFLNQQLSKLTASNQLKNNQIRQLHQYIALLKKEHFDSLKDLQMRWKNQRKDRETERQRERDLRQKVEEQYRQKQKLWRNKERQLERDFEKERRQKNKWMLNSDKLQKQVERLFKQNANLEQLYKGQMGKNQKTVIVTGDSKRQLSNQLEKQRIELENKKRLQVDQIKKQYQLQSTRLNHLNERLQNDLTTKKLQYESLQDEFKKISSQYKNIQKINKQKLSDYHKKMATLNSEILLTQNLYQSFIDAKSRVVKKQ